MYLLDTNICIYLMKNTYPSLTERLLSSNLVDLAVSVITVFFELGYGATKSNWREKSRHKQAMVLSPFNILPFTADDAVVAGRLRGYLECLGLPIGPYDVQIAVQWLARGMTVLTYNIGEFSCVPNLKLEDWII